MKYSRILFWISILLAVIAFITSAAGIFWLDGGQSIDFVTMHDETVQLYGKGIYRFDTAFKAPVLRGADAIILFLGIPLLLFAVFRYRRGSIRAGFLLSGILACFFYQAVSVTFGVAYNNLYLLYVAFLSMSFYALVSALTAVDVSTLSKRISDRFPHRGIAFFLFFGSLSPMVWLMDIISSLINGTVPPLLDSYTTDITTALDVGIIAPACILTGIFLLKRKPQGYLLAPVLLTFVAMIGLIVVGQTVMQNVEGIRLSSAEIAAFVVPFVVLSVVAIWLVSVVLRHISEDVEA